ncbi:MAG: hypothetical protein QME73_03320 [Bacillota bacterium]|nr:hypothetical protein [Bacillota bacterium]
MKKNTATLLIIVFAIVLLWGCRADTIDEGNGGQPPDTAGDSGVEPITQVQPDPQSLTVPGNHDNGGMTINREELIREFADNSFKKQQVRYQNVRKAVEEKYPVIKELFADKGMEYPPHAIFIRAFKKERTVELWAQPDSGQPFVLVTEYEICRLSGELGPKRQEGDRQVPEGFYHINVFNPSSSFLLSLGINYPNQSDCILGVQGNLGGEIFIHGGCATIGCIPITDDKIMELYLIAVETKSKGQDRIPVHIFPCRMDDEGMEFLKEEFGEDSDMTGFWNNLKEGYDYFEQNQALPVVNVDDRGRYVFPD